MTYSDHELDRQIAYLEGELAKAKEGSWMWVQWTQQLKDLKRQRALPREQRLQWKPGII